MPKDNWEIKTATGEVLVRLRISSVAQGLREGWIRLSDQARQPGEEWSPISQRLDQEFPVAVLKNPTRAYAWRWGNYGSYGMMASTFVAGLSYTCVQKFHLPIWRAVVAAIFLLLLFPLGVVYIIWMIVKIIGHEHDLDELLPWGTFVNYVIIAVTSLAFCWLVPSLTSSVFSNLIGTDFDTFNKSIDSKNLLLFALFFLSGSCLGFLCGYGAGYVTGAIFRHRYKIPSTAQQ